jgi:hypothetical protein
VTDTAFINRRRISHRRENWARKANAILLAYGGVTGSVVYEKRHQARWRARYLIGLLADLDLHKRSNLIEHTDRKGDGWGWTIERIS